MLQDVRCPDSGALLFKHDPETGRVEIVHRFKGLKRVSRVMLAKPKTAVTSKTAATP